ncbi:MAG TPA: phosphotransferase [Candidatus Limnocylindrales bacterium]|nr:phosphotransferase [Candidatus Limnocylindrales bacterium]
MTRGQPEPVDETALAGGMGSGGAVVRVGDTVRRPIRPHSAAVQAFLRHLEAVGFAGAPRFLGIDEQGREVLSWIDGDVGLPPYPAWVGGDDLLRSVARLQRQLHEAARTFSPPPDAAWDRANLPDPGSHAIVCHNDLCVENVVVRDGRAVAFIDFDFAAPSDPLLDIAIAARHWIPIRDPVDVDRELGGLDQLARFRAFCDEHALDRRARRTVVDHLGPFLDRALVSMRLRAESGLEAYRRAWDAGYPAQNRRSRAWLDRHASDLVGRS